MNSIAKTFIVANSSKKWSEFNLNFKGFLRERDPLFDELCNFIQAFYNQFKLFPNFETFEKELTLTGEDRFFSYIKNIALDPNIPVIEDDLAFISYLNTIQKISLEKDIYSTLQTFQNSMSVLKVKSTENLLKQIEGLVVNFHKIKTRAAGSFAGSSSLLYGPNAADDIKDAYYINKAKKHNKESLFFDLGIKGFEGIQIKKGDVIFIGGYTSHGKSVWLRYMVYRSIVEYGMNAVLLTFEMSMQPVKSLFAMLHANNKNIFPGTPILSYTDFKNGALTDEQEDFLFNVANQDLFNNKNYGTLYIEEPGKTKYRMSDLQTKLIEVEASIMPIHLVGLDYLTIMYPLESDKGTPDTGDYNQSIKDFKNMARTHKNAQGLSSPFIGISPCQISRTGLDNCLKANGYYDLTALKQYSELEASGDIILTSLLTREMREAKQIRLQNLKNRDGVLVLEPVDLHIDLDVGFTITELDHRSDAETVEALKTLEI